MKKLEIKPLNNTRQAFRLLVTCIILYTFVNCGRLNYSATLVEIVSSGLFEKDVAGLCSTSLFVCYGVGQIINGFISDKKEPFGLVFLGVIASGIINVLFYIALKMEVGIGILVALWGINGFLSSMIWPSIIHIISNIIPEGQRKISATLMFGSTALGILSCYLFCSVVMDILTFKECFLIPGVVLICGAVIWFIYTRRIYKETISYVDKEDFDNKVNENSKPIFSLFIASGLIFILAPICCMSYVKQGVSDWMPTILNEMFSIKPSTSTLFTAILAIVGVLGTLLAWVVNEKLVHNEVKSCLVFFASSVIILLSLGLFRINSIVVLILFLALSSMCMYSVNTLLISYIPVRFGKYGHSAKVTGILNSFAAVFNGVSSYSIGLFSTFMDWYMIFIIFSALCFVGGIVSILSSKKWSKFE